MSEQVKLWKGYVDIMIAKLSLTVAKFFSAKEIYADEKVMVYKYGFELLISTIINLFGILITSILLNTVIGGILFCCAFIPMRLVAGGYHAKHHWSCITIFNTTYLIVALLNKYILDRNMMFYACIMIMVSSILLWAFAPVEAANKPLKKEHRQKQRRQSLLLASFNILLLLVVALVDEVDWAFPLFGFYCSGALTASFSLLVAEITNKHVNTNDK